MRSPLSSKSDTCTESVDVYVTDLSVKVNAHYPGRSVALPRATAIVKWRHEAAEVSRQHSRSSDNDRRLKHNEEDRGLKFR